MGALEVDLVFGRPPVLHLGTHAVGHLEQGQDFSAVLGKCKGGQYFEAYLDSSFQFNSHVLISYASAFVGYLRPQLPVVSLSLTRGGRVPSVACRGQEEVPPPDMNHLIPRPCDATFKRLGESRKPADRVRT